MALIMAQAMRWVNETFPPRARRKWLLMTIRLSIISFAGTVLTLVAVGTWRLASIFEARAFAMPRRGLTTSPASSTGSSSSVMMAVGEVGASAGMGASLGLIEVVFAIGAVTGEGSSPSKVGGTGVAEGAASAGGVAAEPAARDSKSGHHVFSTRLGSC